MSQMPQVGDSAPTFDLAVSTGGNVSLDSLKGHPVVLYFYPKDSTPGCTIEACDFRDLAAEFKKAGAAVFGVSADSIASHEKFIAKQNLNFPLLSDPDHKMLDAYGVWAEKKNYGRTYMGIVRSTFVIDKDGRVAHAWPKVKVKGHAQEVLGAVQGLG